MQSNDANRFTVRDAARPESRMGNTSVEKGLVRSENGRIDEMLSGLHVANIKCLFDST